MLSEIEPEVDYYSVTGSTPTTDQTPDDTPVDDAVLAILEPEVHSTVKVDLTIGKPYPATTVSYHVLSYDVTVGSGISCRRTTKQILHELSGVFKPGMNAIMGPSGSGKTTLLDILSGRTEQRGIQGHVLVNGEPPPVSFKFLTGYVVQDDVVVGTLTVRENLMFSANLRLPKTKTAEKKRRRVDKTILELGLTNCADTKIGTEFIRGVSGGERKRCNIGMELIIKPAILFLDEPTTGLDSSTSNAVMALIHSLSRSGRTVIFSIHQPRYSIFKLFDRLTLLAAGRTVFHGPAAEALTFFQSIGHICEEFNNPPDFFLDTINGDSSALKSIPTRVLSSDKDKLQKAEEKNGIQLKEFQKSPDVHTTEVDQQEVSLAEQLSASFSSSVWARELEVTLKPIFLDFTMKEVTGNEIETNISKQNYKASFLQQLHYLSKRCFVNLIRDPHTSLFQIIIAVLFGAITGIIYLQVGFGIPGGIQNRIGALFFLSVYQVFSGLSGIEVFIKERVFFVHENASGFYRVSSYFVSKVFYDFIPIRLVPLIFSSVIAYFMIGLQLNAGKFFIFLLVLFLTTVSSEAVIFAISASVNRFAIATQTASLIFIFMQIFGGFYVNLASMPDWLNWLRYLSIMYYSFNALVINELDGETFYATNSTVTVTGTQYLTSLGIQYETAWDFWQNVMALGLITIGVLFIAYVQLRRMKKLK